VSGEQARALAGGGLRPSFPEPVALRLLESTWRTGLGDTPPGVLPFLVHPWVVANDRLRAAGWEPQHSNEEALVAGEDMPRWRAALSSHRQTVSLAVAGTALAGAAAGAGVLIRRRLRA
jgi:hypothetical protein